MKSLLCLAYLFVLLSLAYASGHSGIHIGIPLPFIKIRFVDIAHLFGGHGGGHGGGGFGHGGIGLHGGIGHAGFGFDIGGGGHHGW